MPCRCGDMREKTNNINKGFRINKLQAVTISCLCFFTYRVLFLIKHIGYFAFDEFYHISTLNSEYITDYNRAQYINFLVKIVCKLFGQSDAVVKTIPLLMGTISFLCGMYLMYNIYNNPYWIITISSVLICLPNMVYNHFYIRMYVFLEAVIMLDCLLLFMAERKRGTKLGVLLVLLAEALTAIYSFNTNDFSSKALQLFMLGLGVYYFCRIYIRNMFKEYLFVKIGVWLILFLGVFVILFIVAAKQHWFGLSVFGNAAVIKLMGMNLESFYHADSPVFLQFIFGKLFYISIPFVISSVYVWRKNIQDGKILSVIAGLPLLGYMTLLYDSYLLRTYIAFFPILCIVSCLAFDNIKLTELQHLTIIYVVLLLTINGQYIFWKSPKIANETAVSNLGEAVEVARELEKQGYEIVTFMTYETQSAYFDLLNVNINLNIKDVGSAAMYGNDNKYAETLRERRNYVYNTMDEVLESETRRVLVADPAATVEFEFADWKGWSDDRCELRKFEGGASVIIIN